MAAIGADWTALQSNPAGLGAYRLNEFTITAGAVTGGAGDISLDGGTSATSAADTRAVLPQMALVLTREPIASDWTQVNFGFGVSQVARHEEFLRYAGRSGGSISDFFLDEANLYALDADGFRDVDDQGFFILNTLPLDQLSDFGTGLAFDAGLLVPSDETNAPGFYETDYDVFARRSDDDPGEPIAKRGQVTRRGYNSGFDFSVGGNWREQLLVGATLTIATSEVEESIRYDEEDDEELVDVFVGTSYRQTLVADATGASLRVGAIYRASQALRVGLAYHSPAWLSVTDQFGVRVDYDYQLPNEGVTNGSAASPQNDVLEYNFRTPASYRASAAGILGRRGFVSAEVAYLDYRRARFTVDEDFGDAGDFDPQNEAIRDNLAASWQVRLGGELRVGESFSVRAGGELRTTPLAAAPDGTVESPTVGLAAGLGWRRKRLALDAAYKLDRRPGSVYRPYTVLPLDFPQPEVDYTPFRGVGVVTLGYKLTRLRD